MATKGVDFLLYSQTGTDGTSGEPTLSLLGGQRNATLSESSETIDVTSKDSDGAQEFDYGLYSWSISADGVYTVDETGFTALQDAIRNKEKLVVRLQFNDSPTVHKGTVIVTSTELEGSYDAEMTYSCELQGTGKLTNAN